MQGALRRARALDERTDRLREALDVGHETTVWAPTRRRARIELEPYAVAVSSIDHAVRNTRVLARRALSAIEQDDRVPEAAIAAVRELASAVAELALDLADASRASELEQELLRASAHATAALDVTGNLSANMITGQVGRSPPTCWARSGSSRATRATPSAGPASGPGSNAGCDAGS